MTNTQWFAGQLIQEARESLGLSKAKAAHRSGLSESWWRRIETGINIKDGKKVPIKATPEALAKAAHAVGLPAQTIIEAAGLGAPSTEREALLEELHTLASALPAHLLPEAVAFTRGLTVATGRQEQGAQAV